MKKNILILFVLSIAVSFSSDFNGEDNYSAQDTIVEPKPEEFVPVEKQPQTDMAELQRSIVYPEMAKKAGVEGKVVLRILIDTDGSVRKVGVIRADSQLLTQSAIDAVKKAKFTPAIQKGEPVMVWVSIPITYKLGDEDKGILESFFDWLFD